MNEALLKFIQSNSPDGGFLQSEHWRKFQESVGRRTHNVSAEENSELIAYANVITHSLPIVGNYYYVPRGPVFKISNFQFPIFKQFLNDLISNVEDNKIGWIRVEPNSEEDLDLIRNNLSKKYKIKKSSVDMQPREILILDISKSEEEILASMKQKTRYNIRLSKKRGVVIRSIKYQVESIKYFDYFLRLVKITAERDKIISHQENYYRKMFEVIPGDILKLYVAEYEGKIIAANLVVFFGHTATYLHGASDNSHRDVMAPYLLQWRQIQDAKKSGCTKYDFGGIKKYNTKHLACNKNNWRGITRFKQGFAPETKPIQFPGCYDIILRSGKYRIYRMLQRVKKIF